MGKIGILMPVEDEELVKKISDWNIVRGDNAPLHITCFIFESNKKNLGIVTDILRSIVGDYFPLKLSLKGMETTPYGSARLLVNKDEKLHGFHLSVLSKVAKFRDRNLPSKIKRFYGELSDEEKELVDLYGRTEVMHRYNPHISLGKTNETISSDFSKGLLISKVGVYYDGGDGKGWVLHSLI